MLSKVAKTTKKYPSLQELLSEKPSQKDFLSTVKVMRGNNSALWLSKTDITDNKNYPIMLSKAAKTTKNKLCTVAGFPVT